MNGIQPRTLGRAMVAAAHDTPLSKLNIDAARAETLAADETFGRAMCKLAATRLYTGDATKTVNGQAYIALADDRTPWKPGYRIFSDAVMHALGRSSQRMKKQAFLAEALMVPGVLNGSKDFVPGVMRTALALGVLTGLTGGAGLHVLSRDSRQSSADNEELLAKAMEYARMREEIEEDLKGAGVKEETNDKRHII